MKIRIPALQWISNYNSSNLSGDLSAGLTAAIMLIPQGMAYAMLAGLPPVIGLYASTIPLFIYALFGSSPHLAVGPVAMISLLVASGISPLAATASPEYINLALLLALMSGVILFVMGLLRLGFIVNLLSHSVISGFTSASAIIIGISQLKHLLGINLGKGENIFQILWEALQRIDETNWITFSIGIVSIAVLKIFRKRFPKLPTPLLVVVGNILVVYLFRLDQMGVKITGDIPRGLPAITIPNISVDTLISLLPIAITISLLGFMESIAVAKALAAKEKYPIDSNQELIGLGLANIAAGIFSGFPVTGGFSRSAVNYQAGARTSLASIISAIIITFILLFLTPLFYYLPNAVLAATIMVAVVGLIDLKEAKKLFAINRLDGWTLLITFLTTLILGIEEGILFGVAFSLLIFIVKIAYPIIVELGYLEEHEVFKNVKRYPDAKTYSNVLILRIDGPLYFVNMAFLEDRISSAIAHRPNLEATIIDFTGVNDIDATAIHGLEDLMKNYDKSDVEFIFSGVKGHVKDMLLRADWNSKYKEQISYLNIQQALEDIDKK